jgi:hypothetical protein
MREVTTVFQYEIRYSHILNFSQEVRKLLSPFVQLASSIKFEGQNTVDEKIIFTFNDDDYVIIINWDRILFKGQGDMTKYTAKNSPMETPFFSMLEKVMAMEEFGVVKNVLFATNLVKEFPYSKEEVVDTFIGKTLRGSASGILDESSDIAINLEQNDAKQSLAITYGPYLGEEEINKRKLLPVNIDSLDQVDFVGAMIEHRHLIHTSTANFKQFVELVENSVTISERIWKTL